MGKSKRVLRSIYISLFLVGVSMLVMDIFFPKKSITDSIFDREITFDLNKNFGENTFVNDTDKSILFENSEKIEVNTKVYDVTFSTHKGNLISLKLKDYLNLEKNPTELLNLKTEDENFFKFSFDNAVKDIFKYRKIDDSTHEFVSNFKYGNRVYEYIKRYNFSESNEYLIKLDIFLKNTSGSGLEGISTYELVISPHVEKLSEKGKLQYSNHINQVIYYDTKLRYTKDEMSILRPKWVGVSAKYFEILLKKENMDVKFKQNDQDLNLHVLNEVKNSEEVKDSFYIYAGPKDSKYLSIYNNINLNSFGVSDFNFDASVDKSILYFIQAPMQMVMQIFYDVIPNWGLSIMFLTIVVRILMFPLTFKSSRATAELSKLQPRMKDIQIKHKHDSKKLNEEMSKLYKEESVNPLGGCLPILLQLPVLFSLYGLVNNFFLLKGAIFIPGWIDDLSIGDSIYYFGYKVPILGWTDIRLLPLIMMFTQLLSTVVSSNVDLKNLGSQQKVLYFGMPIMFFFILYNMPAGLLVYWVTTNIFTIFQQYYIKMHLS